MERVVWKNNTSKSAGQPWSACVWMCSSCFKFELMLPCKDIWCHVHHSFFEWQIMKSNTERNYTGQSAWWLQMATSTFPKGSLWVCMGLTNTLIIPNLRVSCALVFVWQMDYLGKERLQKFLVKPQQTNVLWDIICTVTRWPLQVEAKHCCNEEHVVKWIGRLDLRSEGLRFDSHCWSCVEASGKLLIPYCLCPPSSNGYLVERKKWKIVNGISCRKCAGFSPEEMRPCKREFQYQGCKL